ncbi:hypothetical protein PR048_019869 [Dryococelus australis]|uniref:Uncharacterized protein n=1 Tax=Dryococelus australis TaxID=614101 RepID=A0ABQ9H4Q4_9NEOP|nr:hypothetical protein PR048_019869 [Dryococelus australis]
MRATWGLKRLSREQGTCITGRSRNFIRDVPYVNNTVGRIVKSLSTQPFSIASIPWESVAADTVTYRGVSYLVG